jgi:hypothetical protein
MFVIFYTKDFDTGFLFVSLGFFVLFCFFGGNGALEFRSFCVFLCLFNLKQKFELGARTQKKKFHTFFVLKSNALLSSQFSHQDKELRLGASGSCLKS